jgi:hypothetical protein
MKSVLKKQPARKLCTATRRRMTRTRPGRGHARGGTPSACRSKLDSPREQGEPGRARESPRSARYTPGEFVTLPPHLRPVMDPTQHKGGILLRQLLPHCAGGFRGPELSCRALLAAARGQGASSILLRIANWANPLEDDGGEPRLIVGCPNLTPILQDHDLRAGSSVVPSLCSGAVSVHSGCPGP